MAEKIVEKAHCPHCGDDLCTDKGIYLWLETPDRGQVITFLSKKLGDYTVPLRKGDSVPQGTELAIRCGRCLTPVNGKGNADFCILNKVKLVGDPYEDYVLKFLSKMGEHGTILRDGSGRLIDQWGESPKLPNFEKQEADTGSSKK